MEHKDIDIYDIFKNEEYGTELYTPICGKVWHSGMANDKDYAKAIWTEDEAGREHFFDKNGKIYKEGEVLLFPSKEMRDWSKFFKKGDVLVHRNGDVHVIFEGFKDNRYTKFKGKHYLWKECFEDYSKEQSEMITFTFRKASDDEAQTYINTIEKFLGGKLNRETLEIEKPEKLKFEVGRFYVFNEDDEDGELTIIGKLIDKNESEDTLTFGDQYEIENQKFVTDQTFDLRISVQKELREATEGEILMFQKARDIWRKEKEAREHREQILRATKEWRKRNREKYRAYQKEYWRKHYRNYGTKNRVADRAMRERKKPDVEKVLSMFKNPQQAAHLAWLLENKKNNRS